MSKDEGGVISKGEGGAKWYDEFTLLEVLDSPQWLKEIHYNFEPPVLVNSDDFFEV